jgi:AraC-like DNA-binding protein
VFTASGAEHYHRTSSVSHWASMSLTPEELAAAAHTIAGYDLAAPTVTRLIRPPPHLMSRLLHLHEIVGRLAATVPDVLAHPEVARAMEQELVRVMVRCLTDGVAVGPDAFRRQRMPVLRRLERFLEENQERPLYVTEVCAAIGVTDRTLRLHCLEHLGMNPNQYLWLRRMHLAQRALALADPAATTVTVIANDHGFGELGRFAVTYRKLFGEPPSATLRRKPDHRPVMQN